MTTANSGHSPENQPTAIQAALEEASRAVAMSQSGVPDEVGALKERLRFYESFDRLITENVTRSSELLREAIDLRERAELERAQLQADKDRALATERQYQRDVLSAVLQDLISLQQLTERLAQRVTDALEAVESQLEPPGLQAETSSSRPVPPEPADLLSLGAQPEPAGGMMAPVDTDTTSAADESIMASYEEPSGFEGEASAAGADEELLEEAARRDVPESGAAPSVPEQPDVEALPGEGEESAPAEMEETAWAEAAIGASVDEARDRRDEGASDREGEREQSPVTAAADRTTTEAAESANWFATGATPATDLSQPGGTLDAAAAAANQTAPVVNQNGSPATQPSAGSESSAVTESAAQNSEERATDRGPFRYAESVAEVGAPAASLTENHPQTLIVEGVPTAALALSLHRYLTDLPFVRSVETREFHSGRLRLNLVTTSPITLEDLRRWPQGGQIEPVYEERDLLEVRLGPSAGS